MSRVKAKRILGSVWDKLPEEQKERFSSLSERTTEQNLRIQANNYLKRNSKPTYSYKGNNPTSMSYNGVPNSNSSKGSVRRRGVGGSWQPFEGDGAGGSWESNSNNKGRNVKTSKGGKPSGFTPYSTTVTQGMINTAKDSRATYRIAKNSSLNNSDKYAGLTQAQKSRIQRDMANYDAQNRITGVQQSARDRYEKSLIDSALRSNNRNKPRNANSKAWEARDILIKSLGNKGFNSLSTASRKDLIRAYANGTQSADQIRTTAKNMITPRGGGKAPAKPESPAPVYNVDKVVPKDSIASDSIASNTTPVVQPTNTGGVTPPVEKGNSGGQPAKQTIKDTPARTAGQIKKDNTPITYKIRTGDTLGGIAKQYGVSVKELAEANGIDNVDKIVAGKTLNIGRTNGGKKIKPKAKPKKSANRNVAQRVLPSREELYNLINSQIPTAESYDPQVANPGLEAALYY